MNLLLLNDTYFGPAIEEGEVQVLRVGPGPDNDIVVDPDQDDIKDVIDTVSFVPDAILQVDSINRRIFFKGLDRIDAPLAFYAIDAPINDFWQMDFAHGVDRLYVDQKEQVESWRLRGISWAQWLPLAADRAMYYPPAENSSRDIDLLFVGTVDHERRPKRTAILHRLRQVANVTLVDGGGTRSVPAQEVADLYRRAKLVLNELLFDGINLRTFEAMACGAVLLTEAGRGEAELFVDGRELATFDAESLEAVVLDLLEDDDRRMAIGDAASDVIRARHTVSVRARTVLKDLAALTVRPERRGEASQARVAWAQWMATWKWDGMDSLRRRSAELIVQKFHRFDPAEQAVFLEGIGQAARARDYLRQMLESGAGSPSLRPLLASLALSIGDEDTARQVLDMESGDRVAIHIELGNRLAALGTELTPGFNRMKAPRTTWTAFEHFATAFALDESNWAAINGLDRVLVKHHAPEFMLPLWQRFHSRNPRRNDVKRLLIQRARSGYLMTGKALEARRNGRPFSRARRPGSSRARSSASRRLKP